jgi:hypothetical protein
MTRSGELHDAVHRGTNGFLEPVSKEMLQEMRQMIDRFHEGMTDLKKEDWSKNFDDEK